MKSSREENPIFLKIRLAALEKAFDEVGHRRMALEESLNRGKISKNNYQESIIKLIAEGTRIKSEQDEVSNKLRL